MKILTIFALGLITTGCELGSLNKNTSNIKIVDSENILFESPCEFDGTISKVYDFRVIDGDTIEGMLSAGYSERIRLVGIDAPESHQDYGNESTKILNTCLQTDHITVEWNERDRYDRILGKIKANGKDCNLNQVLLGAAWHYKFYQDSQVTYDRFAYSNAEVIARKNKKGIWSSSNFIAPWDYRKGIFNNTYKLNNTIYDLKTASCSKGNVITLNPSITIYDESV